MKCEERVYSITRATSAVGGHGLWLEEKVCSIMNFTSAVRAEKNAAPGVSHLQYKQSVVQCEEKVYSIRIVTSAVGGQGVWCEEKACNKRIHICSMRREAVQYHDSRICSMKREGCTMLGENIQYKNCYIYSNRTGFVV